MPQIAIESLMTLEAYAKARNEFRTRVVAHKKQRTLAVGPDVTLIFEDELTIRYQIQEMLRIEKIFEEDGIRDELQAYNPLVPDGSNWKATMMLEYPDRDERHRMLARLIGVEDRVWIRAQGCARVFATADEDLQRETEEKTSSVHFLRFDLDRDSIAAALAGASLALGIDHPQYRHTVDPLPDAVRNSLQQDLRQ